MAIRIGDLAPDIALPPEFGGARHLSDLRGAPIVLAFHEPQWDPARVTQIDGFRRLAREVTDAGAGADSMFIRNDAAAATLFDVAARSAVFIVDADGKIGWRHVVGTDAICNSNVESQCDVVSPADCAVPASRPGDWSRREFVATALAAFVAVALEPSFARAESITARAAVASTGDARPVTLDVNGRTITLALEPRVTLLDALREYAGLTGSKKGCDHGQCGACTVHVDGRRVLSCLTFAVMQQGKAITTIEGLAAGSSAADGLHPMQQAFIEHDGFQCGYCTSGQIMSATAVLHEPWGPTDDDVREAMSGNICRCGAYPGIVAAIQDVRRNTGGQGR